MVCGGVCDVCACVCVGCVCVCLCVSVCGVYVGGWVADLGVGGVDVLEAG